MTPKRKATPFANVNPVHSRLSPTQPFSERLPTLWLSCPLLGVSKNPTLFNRLFGIKIFCRVVEYPLFYSSGGGLSVRLSFFERDRWIEFFNFNFLSFIFVTACF
ncbi:MAG: hypothetical protein LBK82_10250 [Planctomycetaceae bacterium]|nr:hypothetical protein [Planctomycetaceae bacterium]